MVQDIHVLILGFDAQRLVKPLSSGAFPPFGNNSESYSPDRVLLIRDEHDPENPRTDSPRGELLLDTYKTVHQDLEHYLDVDVEEDRMPLFSDFTEVFRSFYRFFDERAEDARITFNLSAAPKSTALAVEVARAAWASERPDRVKKTRLFYFKPTRYLEAETREQLNEMTNQIKELSRERDSFRSGVEEPLVDALTQPVRDSLKRVKKHRDEVREYIEEEMAESDEADMEDEDGPLDKLSDAVDEVASTVDGIFTMEDDTTGQLEELETYSSKSEDLTADIEENPGQIVDDFRKEYNRRITDYEVPDRKADPLIKAVTDLDERVQTMVETRQSLRTEFDSFLQEITHTEQTANKSEDLLDTIDRTGMTSGIRGSAEDWDIPLPPTADLRQVEKVILYVLANCGDQRSVQALARATAKELRLLAEEIGAHPEEIEMETPSLNCCVRMESDEQLGDDFEEFLADRLANRLQYNLQSLQDKGYIHRRESEDDSRRVETTLSDTGELWRSIRESSEIRRTALEEELREQLQEFAE